ncbi:MAG: 5-oxoprolinase subunit PxpB [Gammaproteobacteria bacterium]
MNTHFVGDSALLIDTRDAWAAQQLCLAIRKQFLKGLRELVPAYNSLLLEYDALEFDVTNFLHLLPKLMYVKHIPVIGREHDIAVTYNGEDLSDVAKITGLDIDEVIRRHSSVTYTVAFLGFAPGFPYLTGLDAKLQVPRLRSPRTQVPAGSVAIAGEFSGIYPRNTPGGWRLLGRTDTVLFDPDRASPALLAPGDKVHFRPVA